MPLPSKTLPNKWDREPYLGAGARGPQWGEIKRELPCRMTNRQIKVTSASGSVRVSSGTMIIRPEDKPTTSDRVWVDGDRYEVLQVIPLTGATRIEGYQVAIG